MSTTHEVHFTVDPDGGPVTLKIEFVPAKTTYQRAADAAAENFDMEAAQARWARWDAALAHVLEPDEPLVEPILSSDFPWRNSTT